MIKKICAVLLTLIISLAFTTVVFGAEDERDFPMLSPNINEAPMYEISE